MIVAILATTVIALLWWKWYSNTRIPSRFPPGPLGLPFLGHLPTIRAKNILIGFHNLHQKYGPVCSVNLGPSNRIVIVGDYEALKICFRDDSATDRPPSFNWFNKYFRYGNGTDSRGIICSIGEEWQEQRRFVLRHLRDFGFGKSSMEVLIQEELQELFQDLDSELGQPVGVSLKFNISVVNALWQIMTGQKFRHDDKALLEVVDRLNKFIAGTSRTSLVQVFRFLQKIAPEWSGFNSTCKTMFDLRDFVKPTLAEHVKNHRVDAEPNDLMDVYLNKVAQSADNPKSSFHGELGLQNLEVHLFDLLIAGAETTSTALTWSILLMLHHPKVLKNVQEEIEMVVGNARLPLQTDRPHLPYVEATIQEILRYTVIAPTGIPHYTTKDVDLGNLLIPAGTTIFPNLYEIMRNPKDFPNPDEFKPERFLDQAGKYVRNERNISFSIGKRDCLGQTLAQAELFLFFTGLVQRYDFKTVGQNGPPTLEARTGMTRSPQPYEVILTRRSASY